MNYSPFILTIIITIIISTIITFSRSNWLIAWIAIEINLISFLPLIFISSNYQETEARVKYFLAQSVGSSLLLIRSIILWIYDSINISINTIIILALVIKIGIFPCHIWYISVISSVSWITALILSTWQKVGPLILLSFSFINNNKILTILAALNALTGGIIGLNQSQLRTIIAYSSITHLGWITRLISTNNPTYTIIYFLTYIALISPIFLIFNNKNILSINQTNKTIHMSQERILILRILLISLGGIPPLIGFFPKLITINILLERSILLLLIIIVGSLCNLYFYLRILFSNVIITPKLINTIKSRPNKKVLLISTSILIWIPLLLI